MVVTAGPGTVVVLVGPGTVVVVVGPGTVVVVVAPGTVVVIVGLGADTVSVAADTAVTAGPATVVVVVWPGTVTKIVVVGTRRGLARSSGARRRLSRGGRRLRDDPRLTCERALPGAPQRVMECAAYGALCDRPHRSDTDEVGNEPYHGSGVLRTRRIKRRPSAATRSPTFVSLSKKIAYTPSTTPKSCTAASQA